MCLCQAVSTSHSADVSHSRYSSVLHVKSSPRNRCFCVFAHLDPKGRVPHLKDSYIFVPYHDYVSLTVGGLCFTLCVLGAIVDESCHFFQSPGETYIVKYGITTYQQVFFLSSI